MNCHYYQTAIILGGGEDKPIIAYSRTDIPELLDYIDKLETELHDRRESELRPAIRFLYNTPDKQFKHVLSEVDEIREAIQRLKHSIEESEWQQLYNNLADEIYDAQSSLMTLAYICGLNRDDMIAAGKRKIKANGDRGYYREESV